MKVRYGVVTCLSVFSLFVQAHAGLLEECYNFQEAQNYKKSLEIGLEAVREMPTNVWSYVCVADSYYNLGQYNQAINYLKKAEQYAVDKDELSAIYSLEGRAYTNTGNLNYGLLYLSRALKLDIELNDKRSESADLNNIALIFADAGKYDEAIMFYKKALDLASKNEKSSIINNIAMIYYNEKQYEKAIDYQKEAIDLDKESGDYYGLASDYLNLGSDYLGMNDFNNAYYYIKQGLEMEKNIGNVRWLGNAYVELGDLYRKEGNKELAQKYFNLALSNFTLANDQPGINLVNHLLKELK